MKKIVHAIIIAAGLVWPGVAHAQQESTNTGVQPMQPLETAGRSEVAERAPRLDEKFSADYEASLSEGDRQWMKIVYRELDLNKVSNAALYYPEDVTDGQENLLRIIMRLVADGSIPAYEYLDGREVFSDRYRVEMKDVLDRFHIPYSEAKGKCVVDEADVPVAEVMSYYLIERWEFDNRNSRVRTQVEAICPVLHRLGDFGGEPLKYPMFWIEYSDLHPYLMLQPIFTDDDNNMPAGTYADYFALTRYDGEIYKTRNLLNKSLMQLYPDPADLKRAQDSIDNRLGTFEDKLWVPDREEVIAARLVSDSIAAASGADKPAKSVTRVNGRKSTVKKSTKSSGGVVTRSVRRKK